MRKIIVLLTASVVLLANTACGRTYTVIIEDNKFSPATTTGGDQEDGVQWENDGTVDHNSTSDIGLWDTGTIPPGNVKYIDMNDAGVFAYHDASHTDLKGTVTVPTLAFPTAGHVGDNFTVTWASSPSSTCCPPDPAAVPSGFNADIQVKAPHKKWKNLFTDQTGTNTNGTYTPAKPGKYQFRARLQNDSTGEASGYSPTAVIQVDP
jgi:plastocyanin